ncbi:Transcriptional regulator GlxA family, contains an amidase domain and an AraC-type DNA-binding HTH domain [Variovorax sp. YR752]|uniref:GlxA family transcriptional regulator n=1 Tax=Variovorax sp. YR752 TaxID=1884383 RepID=UPI000BDD6BBE|nr:helix-turn-helix domain-containing protein [Variovorax sp. YR752]SOD30420.1 Transcriptional regulator GlxA family, contains an amidase domain and an AraC-type DNA-binding HTH domain [Variovorax sp. YR752]
MHDFTVLVLPGAFNSSVAVTLDILGAAQAVAARAGVAPPRWRLCSVQGGPVRLQAGMSLETARLPVRVRDDRSTWVVPGLGLNTPGEIRRCLDGDDAAKAIAGLVRHAKAGGQVAASCSAVFLLNAAGLLQGRRATTSWWYAALLKQMAPGCTVDVDRMVCSDGSVVTAGAAFAQTDLMLHLLRERCGSALTDLVSRMLLIDGRQAQAPFIVPEVLANGNDLVARLAARVESALPDPPAVSALAREFCMSERTLSRHIQKATGRSTQALVQSVRLRRARALLESSRMTVEQVASAVGYQDATALRRLMKKMAGANPSRYRG